MKRFEFSLQKVYDVKKIAEDQLMLQQEQIKKRLNRLQNEKGQMLFRFAKEKEAYDSDCQKGISAINLQSYGEYFDFLMEAVKRQDVLIGKCMQEKEKCTQLLVGIMNEMKVLEKIREEQLSEYNKELRKNDDKMLEDFLCGRM